MPFMLQAVIRFDHRRLQFDVKRRWHDMGPILRVGKLLASCAKARSRTARISTKFSASSETMRQICARTHDFFLARKKPAHEEPAFLLLRMVNKFTGSIRSFMD